MAAKEVGAMAKQVYSQATEAEAYSPAKMEQQFQLWLGWTHSPLVKNFLDRWLR